MNSKVKKIIAKEWLLFLKVEGISIVLLILIGFVCTDNMTISNYYEDNLNDVGGILTTVLVPYILVQLTRSAKWAHKITKENNKS